MDVPKPENEIESTKEKLPHESRLRSMLKAVSWRILATFTTVLIAYVMTGDVSVAMKIGVVEVVAKMLIYYFRALTLHLFSFLIIHHWEPTQFF